NGGGTINGFVKNDSVYIPEGVSYQFRNSGDEPLEFCVFTTPMFDQSKQHVIEKNNFY
ncbi:unnamed protein product, partial [marine sediment metagenome]